MLLIQYNHPFNGNKFDNLGRSKNLKPKKNATLTLELIKAEIKSFILLKIWITLHKPPNTPLFPYIHIGEFYHMLRKKITSILYKFSENEAGMGGNYYPTC